MDQDNYRVIDRSVEYKQLHSHENSQFFLSERSDRDWVPLGVLSCPLRSLKSKYQWDILIWTRHIQKQAHTQFMAFPYCNFFSFRSWVSVDFIISHCSLDLGSYILHSISQSIHKWNFMFVTWYNSIKIMEYKIESGSSYAGKEETAKMRERVERERVGLRGPTEQVELQFLITIGN